MVARPSEFVLISRLFAPLATVPGAFGLTDDVALLQHPDACDLVVTTDTLVEGVHFLSGDPADFIARKALRQNLSDLAAKGAEPLGYLLALSLPSAVTMDWLELFAGGLAQDQCEFCVPLLGGDTTGTPGPLTVCITAVGSVPRGVLIRRAGAQAGDLVYVSGTIGDAGAGLAILKREAERVDDFLVNRYRLPNPRISLGKALRGIATASLDVSDGLIADLGHIASSSGVRLIVYADAIPLSRALQELWGRSEGVVVRAATSGDDFEIAFTAPPEADMAAVASTSGISITRIGQVISGQGVLVHRRDRTEIPITSPGFTHF
ncbi:MAG: thiamine-phosphate kinase [Alphaproteobacteria bacterium]|nr:thiamine-phosphate kinase [Alphaproteobacteria bacterium]